MKAKFNIFKRQPSHHLPRYSDNPFALKVEKKFLKEIWIDTLILTLIGVLTISVTYGYYPKFAPHVLAYSQKVKNYYSEVFEAMLVKNSETQIAEASPIITAAPAPLVNEFDFRNKHPLNGVFISEGERLAMINNVFFRTGDKIDGMQITAINLEEVTLANEQDQVTLRMLGA